MVYIGGGKEVKVVGVLMRSDSIRVVLSQEA